MANRAWTAAGAVLLLAACGREAKPAEQETAAVPAIEAITSPALDRLGVSAVAAFVASDTVAVDSLRMSAEEYRDVFYPAVRAANPAAVLPPDVSLRSFVTRNGRAARRYLDRMKGMPLRGESTRCRGGEVTYGDMRLLRDCVVTVADTSGAREEMPIFRDVVVQGGVYRALRFND